MITRFTLRLPSDLTTMLRALAHREGRTLHGQVLFLLRKAIQEATHASD